MQPSILDLSKQLRAGKISPVDLTQDCLARIEKLNPVLNAFITVTADSALAQAHQAEAEIQPRRMARPAARDSRWGSKISSTPPAF